MCCSVLPCVAVSCSVLQCVAVCCSVYSLDTKTLLREREVVHVNVGSASGVARPWSLVRAPTVVCTGWRRLIGSPKLQIIFHKRATKYRALLRKMTYKDKGSYESSPPCSESLLKTSSFVMLCNEDPYKRDSRGSRVRVPTQTCVSHASHMRTSHSGTHECITLTHIHASLWHIRIALVKYDNNCVAGCCRVLQGVAVCCRALLYVSLWHIRVALVRIEFREKCTCMLPFCLVFNDVH